MGIALSDIERLSVKERIELIGYIWDSIEASSVKIELTQAQKDELDRRMTAYRIDHDKGAPWEEVEEEIERSLNE